MRKFTKLALASALGLASTSMSAQIPAFQWAKGFGDANNDLCLGIALDPTGNVLHTGLYNGTIDFDPGAGTVNMTSIVADGGYVSKLDASGNFLWAVNLPGRGDAVATDASGNVFIAGMFNGTQDFDPGAGTTSFTAASTSYADVYICKFDNAGNFVWAGQISGTGEEVPESITTDASGNLILTGYFRSPADFDPGAGVATLTPLGSGVADGFVVKWTGAGSYVWATKIGSAYSLEDAFDAAVDLTGNVYVAGVFAGTVDFDPGAATVNMTSSGNDIYLLKLDAAGNFLWAKGWGSFADDEARAVAVDAAGNAYIGGWFASTVDFDPGAGTTNLTSVGSFDCFVSKFDASGNLVFAKSFGSTSFDNCKDLKVAASGKIYITGYYSGAADFDPSAATSTMTSAGSYDSYLWTLDASGNFLGAGNLNPTSYDYIEGLAINAAGDLYIGGSFLFTTDFDYGTGTYNLSGAGGNDIFVMKLGSSSTGINDLVNVSDLKAYPNPSTGVFNFSSAEKFTGIRILNLLGEVIVDQEVNGTAVSLDLVGNAKGIYIYQVMDQSQVIGSGKIILE